MCSAFSMVIFDPVYREAVLDKHFASERDGLDAEFSKLCGCSDECSGDCEDCK